MQNENSFYLIRVINFLEIKIPQNLHAIWMIEIIQTTYGQGDQK